MAVNARGPFLCYKYAAEQMIEQGRGGRILGASSIVGKMGYPLDAPYCASKWAVRGLTQTAGEDHVIRLVCISDWISIGTWPIRHYREFIRTRFYRNADE